MRLTQLQMTGFKSFKNPTKIQFDEGITGIVGPNGCGKSNVVDSILWATGDSMASQLRGQQMDDIIFAGTKNSPQSSYAEVSIIFNKDEGEWPEKFQAVDELIIKRRVKRGGDSQYYINDQPCLQRDVRELLMDAGALGFSIIKQENIIQMVAYKPDQVRALIEQAAGVSKFKHKKRLAENKLKITCQNMQRLEDITQEQSKQLKKLERQAQQAQTYKTLKEQITEIELSSLKEKHEELQNKIQENESDIQKCIEQEKEHRSKLESLQKQYHEGQTASEDLYSKISEERNDLKKELEKLTECEVQVKKLEALITSDTERSQQWKLSVSEFEESQKSKLGDLESSKRQTEKYSQQITTRTQEIESKKAQLEKLQLQYDLTQKNKEDVQSQLDASLREEARLEEAIKSYEQNEDQYKQMIQDLESQISNRESRIQSIRAQCKQLDAQGEKDKKMHLNLEEEIRSIKENISNLGVKQKREEYKKIQVDLIEKESQYKSLLLLKEKTESQMKGYQWVKKEKSLKHLLEVLNVDAGYEKAVTAALDSVMYSFITKDTSASDILKKLKKDKLGQASFILSRETSSKPTANCKGTCLKEKVKFQKDLKLDFLFDQVYVLESLDQMIKESQKYPEITFVTTEGDVLKHGRLLYGGSGSKESDILIQDKEIHSLEEQIKQLKIQFKSLEGDISEKVNQLKKLESYLDQVSSKYNEDSKSIYANTKEHEILKKELSFLEKEHQNLHEKLQKQKEQGNIYLSPKELQEKYNKAKMKKDQMSSKYQEARTQRDQCLDKKNQQKLSLDEAQMSLVHLQKDLKSSRYQEQLLRQSIDEMNKKSLKFSEQVGKNQVQKYQEELKKWKEKWSQQKEVYTQKMQEQESSEGEYQGLISSYKNAEQHISSLNQNIESVLEKKHSLEIDRESSVVEKKNIEEKALENYQISIDQAQSNKGDAKNLEQLKAQLSRIGQVNLLALSEYDELDKEYQVLFQQLEDLRRSKEELEQVIEEMDRISHQKFSKTFKEVNQRFNQVFKSVFGGGHAAFRMVENGVEIEACPPEKRLKSLKLLSGGEKSLVALSVVVSLFLIRAAPFCVLDEVDAALDDSNIVRYNALVSEIARKSQVIMITHNKHSMKKCDRLYGVTMEEKGVTNLLSVEMKNYQSQQPNL